MWHLFCYVVQKHGGWQKLPWSKCRHSSTAAREEYSGPIVQIRSATSIRKWGWIGHTLWKTHKGRGKTLGKETSRRISRRWPQLEGHLNDRGIGMSIFNGICHMVERLSSCSIVVGWRVYRKVLYDAVECNGLYIMICHYVCYYVVITHVYIPLTHPVC